jgi:hypothetical protein
MSQTKSHGGFLTQTVEHLEDVRGKAARSSSDPWMLLCDLNGCLPKLDPASVGIPPFPRHPVRPPALSTAFTGKAISKQSYYSLIAVFHDMGSRIAADATAVIAGLS